jgi:hypothetical protein
VIDEVEILEIASDHLRAIESVERVIVSPFFLDSKGDELLTSFSKPLR